MRIALGYILTFGWVFLVLGLTLVLKKAIHADDEVSRKIMQLEIEETALSKEIDNISKQRLADIREEKSELKTKFETM